jgi:hypothetical protein
MDQISNVRLPLKAAWPPSRFQSCGILGRGCVLFGLLTALGLLAFFFSVVSPYDDDVQQVFVQGKKPKQCIVTNYKAACEVHSFGTNKVRSALLPQRLLIMSCGVVRHALVSDEEILRTMSSSEVDDRSPPSRSS